MVKPAVRTRRSPTPAGRSTPLAAITSAAIRDDQAPHNGWIDHDAVAIEQLTAVRRAGADMILTYFARWFAERTAG